MRSVLSALCLFASTAHAVPAQFTHQGRLLDADGAPLEDEATIMFRVTDSEVGGTALWEETITTPLTNGFYSAILGASEDNPLDTDVLSQAPAWLELQLDGEPAMFPRSPIHAVPYATMATVAEEISGGPVDASQIAVDGTPVVNELGEWVGPAPVVSWSDIEGMPEDFADGIDDDTVTDSDSFAALGTSCLDGDIPVWDSVLIEWVCGLDAVLTEDEVDAIVADNGYAMESEVFSSSFLDLVDVPDGLDDGDSVLTESEVDSMVADNGYAMALDVFSRMFSDLVGIPEDLADGDDNTQLSEDEVDGMVADNGYAVESDVAALLAEIETLKEQVAELEEDADPDAGTVMYGSYSINNSIDLAAFAGFTEVTGDLTIRAGAIPALHAVSDLTTVGGKLTIAGNSAITNLDALSSLTYIGGALEIELNDALVSLEGLGEVTHVGDRINLESNDALVSLSGLNNVVSHFNEIRLYGNDSLTSLSGLGGLSTANDVHILSNASLASLDGLDGLTTLHSIEISSNPSLGSLEGLEGLVSVSDRLKVYNNSSLVSLNGISGLTELNSIGIYNNALLTDISALTTMLTGDYAYMYANDSLCNSIVVDYFARLLSSGFSGSFEHWAHPDC
jgi:polyhydroxyalkanoate synthesis regulator phasin